MNSGIIISYDEIGNNLITKLDFIDSNLTYPLNVYFVTKNIIVWETIIEKSNEWCSLQYSRNLDIRVIDNNGDLILNKVWSFNSKSDICEIEFIKWCQNFYFNKSYKPNGIVIGSHNGTTGEWVESYNQNLIGEVLLIEPNIKPFNQLVSNYQHDNKFTFKNVVISEHDEFVDFFTDVNSESESSSLILNNLLKNTDTSINCKIKSTTPNNLFTNFTPDWLHIDAEGYDGKILLMIDDEHLNKIKFIIWEHIHLDDDIKIKLKERLESFNFTVTVGLDYNTFAIKN
jgi:FkbM family methyltransferase